MTESKHPIEEFWVEPDEMDAEERRLLPLCKAILSIQIRDHDGNSCCGINAAESEHVVATESRWRWVSVPRALREQIGTTVEGDPIYSVRADLVDADGNLRRTVETASMFANMEIPIGARCWEKGRCGQCLITDTYTVTEIQVIPRP